MTSMLTHTVQCPNCGRAVAASLAHVGQRVACPSCRGEFLLSPTALLAPPAGGTRATSVEAPPVQRPAMQVPVSVPSRQLPLESTPYTVEPPLPPTNVQTAQFLATKPQPPAIAPQADGKLPTLQLADAPDAAAKSGEASPVPLWAAFLAVAASTAVSMILLLGDFTGTQSAESLQAQAREDWPGSMRRALRCRNRTR